MTSTKAAPGEGVIVTGDSKAIVSPRSDVRGRGNRDMPGDTMLRQWEMITSIPRYPSRITAGALQERLSPNFVVHLRTIQRDLKRFAQQFGYTWDEEGKTEHWYYPADHKGIDIPAMPSNVALAMSMAREHLSQLLPPSCLEALGPYFRRADDVIAQLAPSSLKAWKQRVCVISRGPPLQAPNIVPAVQAAVYDALLHARRLTVAYRGRGSAQPGEQLLHPLGLVLREGVLYLVATAWDYDDARHYAVHRMSKAEVLTESSKRPSGFDLAAYVERTFRYTKDPDHLRLLIRMDAAAATHLEERPLSGDQAVKRLDKTHVTISATVGDTDELRWWLLGFGPQVEVLQPKRLRTEMAAASRAMAANYGKG